MRPTLRRAGCAVLSLTCLASLAAAAERKAPPDPRVWITIDSTELEVLRDEVKGVAGDRLPAALESFGTLTLAETRESLLGELAAAMHERYHRCGGFVTHSTLAEAQKTLYASLEGPVFPLVDYTIDNAATVNAISAAVVPANICSTITSLSDFHTRFYTVQSGFDAAVWLKARWEEITAGRPDVLVSFFDHPGWLQHSVMVRIEGADNPREMVVLGAHLDSINGSQPTTGRAPGADDDASGIASLTEMLRAAMAVGYRPSRTVMIFGYAAEEVGIRGSREIATRLNPVTGAPKYKAIGAFQLDMTNFRSPAANAVDVGIIRDAAHTNAAQTDFVVDLIETYQPTLTFADTFCNYGCSDHSAWNVQGSVPASFAFEARFGQHLTGIHTANDTLDRADPTCGIAARFTRIAAAYMAELAKGGLVPLDAGK
jgi:leucyl aminopeptidase